MLWIWKKLAADLRDGKKKRRVIDLWMDRIHWYFDTHFSPGKHIHGTPKYAAAFEMQLYQCACICYVLGDKVTRGTWPVLKKKHMLKFKDELRMFRYHHRVNLPLFMLRKAKQK